VSVHLESAWCVLAVDHRADWIGWSGAVGLSTLVLTFAPAYTLTKLEYKRFSAEVSIKDERISLMQEVTQAISMIKEMTLERYWFDRISKVRDREFDRLVQARLIRALSTLL